MELKATFPLGRLPPRGSATVSSSSWSTRPTSAATRLSSWARAWPVLRRRVAGRAGLQRALLLLPGQPRRAHSIAAQGGINAAKNYQNDGDSVQRLFYDTIKGGDFAARESHRGDTNHINRPRSPARPEGRLCSRARKSPPWNGVVEHALHAVASFWILGGVDAPARDACARARAVW